MQKVKAAIRATFRMVKWCSLAASLPFYYFRQRKKINELRINYNNKKIRVGFVGYLDGASCDIFTDLYLKFKADNNFEANIVVVPYTHDDRDKMVLKHASAIRYLQSLDIEAWPGYDEIKNEFVDYSGEFDIVFFENEYDWVDPLFKIDNFKDCVSFIIPYGQYLADNVKQHLSYPMMSQVFGVFPTSVSVGKMMKKNSRIFGLNIIEPYLGNPKTDKFFNPKTTHVDVWSKSKPSQKRIIWAPHHTWAPYSNFINYAEYMLALANNYRDELFIAIKPHPALKDSLKRINGWSDSKISEYFAKWKNGANTDLFEEGWFDLFMSSDAMVLDSIGFMLEYSLTGKPACVLYRQNEYGSREMRFSDCGEQIYNLLYHAKEPSEVNDFVNLIRSSQDPLKAKRDDYIKENYIPPFGKLGYENIYEYVISLIS